MKKTLVSALLCGALSVCAAAGAASSLLARIAHATVLLGSGHSWGFAALEPTRSYLWLARRENGLTVFDTARRKPLRTLEGSQGANGVGLVPAFDRAYVANTDGSLGAVRLSDMPMLRRFAVSDANLNTVVFEPLTKRVFVSSGRRAGSSIIYVLDPASGRIVAQRDLDIKKIDPPLAPGDGTLLLPMRDEGKVMRLDAATLEVRRPDHIRFAGSRARWSPSCAGAAYSSPAAASGRYSSSPTSNRVPRSPRRRWVML